MSSLTNVVGNDQFKTEVLESQIPVLVDFWAAWCGPCQMMTPVLESLAVKLQGKLKIVKVDTEENDNQQLAINYEIQSIPNMKVFKNGLLLKDFVGYRDEAQFEKELNALLL